jgi:SAM-dependent methyltransferase
MVDWGAGSYETTAAVELASVAEAVVEAAAIASNEVVIDVASGTGNAALAAARRGARVVAIDGAPRLLVIAEQRARAESVDLDLREGDLLALPVGDDLADVVLSVFGIVFAADPTAALREVRRVVRPSGRVFVSAWVPEGPIDAMFRAVGGIVARVTDSRPAPRFAWNDPAALGPVAAEAGLVLEATSLHELAIRAASPEAYVDRNQDHPVAVAVVPAVRSAGAEDELRAAQLSVLREANEDPGGFLVHSPYVVHQLRAAPAPIGPPRRA